MNEAPGNISCTYASVFPRPLNFSTHWLCLTTFDSRDFQVLNERGAVGETPRGAPCLLATSIPCRRVPLRTLHARQALLRAHTCWRTKALERWGALRSGAHSLCPTRGPHLQLQDLFAPKLCCHCSSGMNYPRIFTKPQFLSSPACTTGEISRTCLAHPPWLFSSFSFALKRTKQSQKTPKQNSFFLS